MSAASFQAPNSLLPLDRNLDVVGIGNAIVDVLIQTDDSFLEEHGLSKGTMALIDEIAAEGLYSRAIFAHDIRSVGARFDTPAAASGPSTARCLILVTPDAQRTMCTYLGASVGLDPGDLDLDLVPQAKVLYLEGYLWDSEAAKQAFLTAAAAMRASGGQVALSLSDAFCVDRHRESFLELVDGHVDILFANEMEITSLYKADSFEDAAQQVRGRCQVAALTRSEQGSVVLSGDQTLLIEPFRLGPLVDTTGAGDLYAAGFLQGYTNGASLERCGRLGSLCAGQVVTQLGPRPQASLPALVAKHLD